MTNIKCESILDDDGEIIQCEQEQGHKEKHFGRDSNGDGVHWPDNYNWTNIIYNDSWKAGKE